MGTILRVPDTQFCGVPQDAERRSVSSGESDDPAIKRKPTVLIVDDEHLIADTLAEILSDKGYEATAVYNPRHAIEQISELCPDIVITDVLMPGMNGIELAKLIRTTCPETRILLVSGQAATAELVERAQREGYSFEMLAKPVGPEKLLQRLRSTDF